MLTRHEKEEIMDIILEMIYSLVLVTTWIGVFLVIILDIMNSTDLLLQLPVIAELHGMVSPLLFSVILAICMANGFIIILGVIKRIMEPIILVLF